MFCNHLITRSTSHSDVATTVYAAQKVSACVRTRGSTCTERCSSPNQWECRSAVCGDLAECTTKAWSRTATSAAPHSDGVSRSTIQPWKALNEAHPSGAEPYVVDGRGQRAARRSDRVLFWKWCLFSSDHLPLTSSAAGVFAVFAVFAGCERHLVSWSLSSLSSRCLTCLRAVFACLRRCLRVFVGVFVGVFAAVFAVFAAVFALSSPLSSRCLRRCLRRWSARVRGAVAAPFPSTVDAVCAVYIETRETTQAALVCRLAKTPSRSAFVLGREATRGRALLWASVWRKQF